MAYQQNQLTNSLHQAIEIERSKGELENLNEKIIFKSNVYGLFAFSSLSSVLAFILSYISYTKEFSIVERSVASVFGLACLILLIIGYFKHSFKITKFWMSFIFFSFTFLGFIYTVLSLRNAFITISDQRTHIFEINGYFSASLVTLVYQFLYFCILALLLKDRKDEITMKKELCIAIPSYIVFSLVCLALVRNSDFISYFIITFLALLFLVVESQRLFKDRRRNLTKDDYYYVALVTYAHLIIASIMIVLSAMLLIFIVYVFFGQYSSKGHFYHNS